VTTGSRNLSKHIGHSIEGVVVGMERLWSSYQKEWAEGTMSVSRASGALVYNRDAIVASQQLIKRPAFPTRVYHTKGLVWHCKREKTMRSQVHTTQ